MMTTATDRVLLAYKRIAEVDRPEVWITLRDEADVLAEAAGLDESLPLYGTVLAVKDNIDVAGLSTTAACPEFARTPDADATVVARLRAAGALVLGKTNLDQFATGLVGTRSPYGAVRHAHDPEKISGGSSSGSATAVALGIVDIALGTDTAGSGRVPAAFASLVGIKPTLGLVPNTGVVPACVDYDAVTVFAADITTATAAMAIMIGADSADPRSRAWPATVPLSAPPRPRVAVPRTEDLRALCPEYAEAFERTVSGLDAVGIDHEIVDISVLLDAAVLLYDGAIVAQRYAAVGEFLSTSPEHADPTVSRIVLGAKDPAAHAYVDDLSTLLAAKAHAASILDGLDGLVLPTTTEHPTIAAVQADPLGINRRLGTFTNFCNLLDMAAVAVPGARTTAGDPFGVMVVGPAFTDQVLLDIGAAVADQDTAVLVEDGVDVLVVGAHLRGFPLNGQLVERGARFVGEVSTSADYRLVDLGTTPPKPGLVRGGSASIAGELYRMAPAHLGTFLAGLPAPMGLGSVTLSDGREVVGFMCAADAAEAGTDITEFGGWRAYTANSGVRTPDSGV
ncbi:allophanate hydrolase [Rhodococcus sp. BP-332]|uniref:allophanate hydrolase n=1 Tax=Rhodococcus sp. BP-332 TaxID=2739447 RepID=UPI001C9B6B8C|nr:allophanate hydrolase [Rhodococcus sp. BP-332]MBY6678706.1 allophanate hydrolase [Rhodococcus sp. BP-332]